MDWGIQSFQHSIFYFRRVLLLHPLLAWRDQAASPGEDLHLTWANHLYVDRRIGLYWPLPYKRLLFSATGENTYTSTYSYNLALYIIFVKRKILKLINFFSVFYSNHGALSLSHNGKNLLGLLIAAPQFGQNLDG